MRLWVGLVCACAASAALPNGDPTAPCSGYRASNVVTTDSGLTADLTLASDACNAFGTDLKHLTLEVVYETDDRVHVKIQDRDDQVYQVPEDVFPRPGGRSPAAASNLRFDYIASPFSFQIRRAASNEILFDTSAASLVFESQYLRLRTSLPDNPYLYGLGEHSDPLRLKTSSYVRTLWNRDSYGVPLESNLYGTHPFYLEHRKTGSHGVFLLNSNGMDVVIDKTPQGRQYLEYNTLGGVFDFWFVAGPSPIEAVQQYGRIAGTPAMQPYWGLGFHQCRYGYQDVYDVAEVVQNYSQAGIPLETMWTDIDYMDRRRVFSLDPERFPLKTVRELVSQLHARDQHYIVMVDPAVAYHDYPPLHQGVESDAFLRRDNGSLWLGVVWPGLTVYPDWFSTKVAQYWNGAFARFFSKESGVDIDGLWIDMNEPSNFCPFPCDNPYEVSRAYPPEPPPVRQPPRSLPGWPCAFQPPGTCLKSNVEARDVRATNLEGAAAPESKYQFNPGSGHPKAGQTPESGRNPDSELEEPPSLQHRRANGDRKGLPGRNLLYPKYAIRNKAAYLDAWNADRGGLSNHSVNTDVRHANGLVMYDTHNLYGAMMSTTSREAMLSRRPGLRPFVITRSTFAGTGSAVGHWLGDNLSTWDMYRHSIRSMLAFTALFQFSMVGVDTCGFGGDVTEELCARWAALGAFSTFYRNHNAIGQRSQEFYRWKTVAESARKAIDIRYRLLDYIYTAMYRSNQDGRPTIQPVFYLYPNDAACWALELQYFYGPGLLVAPVTAQGASSVQVYLPDDTFYDWYSHELVRRPGGGGAIHTFVEQDNTTIPLLIRGGVILPARVRSASTTTELRRQDFELLVALDAHGKASGELYLDDGVSIDQQGRYSLLTFTYGDGVLSIDGVFGYDGPAILSKITLIGAPAVRLPGNSAHQTAGPDRHSMTVEIRVPLTKSSNVHLNS
ncbi:hypothetical protein RJ55_04816 [Drechmeria coniospora]|nr:hypothetical protein RJ55_04816 [Drechmeria coniospora]